MQSDPSFGSDFPDIEPIAFNPPESMSIPSGFGPYSSDGAQPRLETDAIFNTGENDFGVGFASEEAFKIPDFFRNFLSAPPVWIKAKF